MSNTNNIELDYKFFLIGVALVSNGLVFTGEGTGNKKWLTNAERTSGQKIYIPDAADVEDNNNESSSTTD